MRASIAIIGSMLLLAILVWMPQYITRQAVGDDEFPDFEDARDLLEAPRPGFAPELATADPFGGQAENDFAPAPRENPFDSDEEIQFEGSAVQQRNAPRSRGRIRQRARVVFDQVAEPVSKEDLARAKKVQMLRTKVRSEKDDSKRDAAASELKMLLAEIFDADFAERTTELEKLEARVKKLRDSLEKRQAARDRILNVQIDSLLLEAEGLTFPRVGGNMQMPLGHSQFQIESMQQNADGSKTVRVRRTTFSQQRRTRAVPETILVPRKRMRRENGRNIVEMIEVPQTQTRTEEYFVRIPSLEVREIKVPRGKSLGQVLERMNAEPPEAAADDLGLDDLAMDSFELDELLPDEPDAPAEPEVVEELEAPADDDLELVF